MAKLTGQTPHKSSFEAKGLFRLKLLVVKGGITLFMSFTEPVRLSSMLHFAFTILRAGFSHDDWGYGRRHVVGVPGAPNGPGSPPTIRLTVTPAYPLLHFRTRARRYLSLTPCPRAASQVEDERRVRQLFVKYLFPTLIFTLQSGRSLLIFKIVARSLHFSFADVTHIS